MAPPRGVRRKKLATELADLHDAAQSAWNRGCENRAKLAGARAAACPAVMGSMFDGTCWHSVFLEPAITVDACDYERWMREQHFPTRLESMAYRAVSETWLDAWLWICRLTLGAEYTRPLALKAAGINVEGFARTQRKRGGLAAREQALLETEIADELASLERLQRDRQDLRRMFPAVAWPRVTKRAARAAVHADQSARWLVTDVQRWHAAKKHPKARALWARLIALREDRIVAVHAAIVAFQRRAEHLAAAKESGIPRP